jgi:membrane associated rhomboid family serine protease
MTSRSSGHRFSAAVQFAGLLLALLFLFEILDRFLPVPLDVYGILPRSRRGLIGILLCPLLHKNMAHLAANALPLFVLVVILFADRAYHPDKAFFSLWLLSGFGTWLIGRDNAIHIGASSLIYGLVVYLVSAAWWLRSWRSASIALLIFFIYGGIAYGLLPRRDGISWEGHLAGAISGWCVARYLHG